MHIRESDTTYDPVDHDEQASSVATEYMARFLGRSDLDLLIHNCGQHIDQGVRAYNEAASKPY